ncbi:MAG: SDR family oxidoreductase [Phycisphaerales bacterium]|nr:SDR family oxidoreductase [Phycisphaerales bacterium]
MPTYLITGANRGLGLEFARQLSTRGKDTVILATAREPDKATDLARLVHEVLPLDAADPASHAALAAKLGDRPVDVLINNAGVSSDANSLEKLTMEELQRVFAVNAFAPLLIAKAILRNIRAGDRKTIFNITSQLGSIANNKGGSSYPYRASKTALNQLTVSLSNELKGEGFTCIMVHPGWVKTDMGGPNATLTPEQSIEGMLKLLDGLKPEDTGKFYDYSGKTLPW